MTSEFWISWAKYDDLSNRATDWFIRSFEFKVLSDEWQLCRLKEKIYSKQATKFLKKTMNEVKKELEK